MKAQFSTVAAGVLAVVVGYVFVAPRTGHAIERTDKAAAAPVANPHAGHAGHEGHTMSSLDEVTRMAAEGDPHANHALEELAWPAMQAAPVNLKLPADAEGARQRLASSPRKGEYVKLTVGGKPVTYWVSYPQGVAKAPVVVVIQEVFGLADWIRGVADQLAAEGFIAIAPDLISGRGPNGGDTPSFASDMERVVATRAVPRDEVTAMLKAGREWALRLPGANGKSASVGFCFGGGESFRFAIDEPNLNAAVVYYGTSPTDVATQTPPPATPPAFVPTERLAQINAPILGLYAGIAQDLNIDRTIPATLERMRALKKAYEPHIFDNSSHGFLRAQTGQAGSNMAASEQAWPMTVAWIKKYTAGVSGVTR